MSDEFDPVRRLRSDGLLPDDPPDLDVLTSSRRQLISDITGSTSDPRLPTPSIYPRLAYRDELAALEFLVRAFGLFERREARMEHPDGTLAWLELGNGVIMIGRSGPQRHGLTSPVDAGATTSMINVYVDDLDAHHRRAVAVGATIQSEPEDMLWGDRRYEALDLEPRKHRSADLDEATIRHRTQDRPASAGRGQSRTRSPTSATPIPTTRPASISGS